MSDSGTQKRCCCKVDCSDNVAAAREQQKPEKNPPKGPAVVLSYPSWWSWIYKTSLREVGVTKHWPIYWCGTNPEKEKLATFHTMQYGEHNMGFCRIIIGTPIGECKKTVGGEKWGLVARGEASWCSERSKSSQERVQKLGENVSPRWKQLGVPSTLPSPENALTFQTPSSLQGY